jgi:hypothetical protein
MSNFDFNLGNTKKDTPPKKRDSPFAIEEEEEESCVAEMFEKWATFEGNMPADLHVTKNGYFVCKRCDGSSSHVMRFGNMSNHCNTDRHKDAVKYVTGIFEKSGMKNEEDFIIYMDQEKRDVHVECISCDETIIFYHTDQRWSMTARNHLRRKGHRKNEEEEKNSEQEYKLETKRRKTHRTDRSVVTSPSSSSSPPLLNNDEFKVTEDIKKRLKTYYEEILFASTKKYAEERAWKMIIENFK